MRQEILPARIISMAVEKLEVFTMETLPSIQSQVAATIQDAVIAYLSSLAPVGRRGIISRLKCVTAFFQGAPDYLSAPWTSLRYEHLIALRQQFIETGWSPATVNLTLTSIRGVLRAAFNLGLISAEHYLRIKALPPVKARTLPAGRELPTEQIAAIRAACGTSLAGLRDAALLSLLYYAGLRRSESISIDLMDLETNDDLWLVVRHGKGGHQRRIPILNGCKEAILTWIAVRGNQPGPLFVRITPTFGLTQKRLSQAAVYRILSRRQAEAHVPHCTPHDMRRSCASHLLDKGADIVTVQKILGHASVNTTARYDRRSEKAQIKALQLLD